MAELLADNTGVSATSTKAAGASFLDWSQSIIQGYLTAEVIKRQNPQQSQYMDWGGLTVADRAQLQQSTAAMPTQQAVNNGIKPAYLFIGGAVVIALVLYLKK